MKNGVYGATKAAKEKIAKGNYKSPFAKKKKGCACDEKSCGVEKTQPAGKSGTGGT